MVVAWRKLQKRHIVYALGLSRYYGAMYTRDQKLANSFTKLSEFTGDRIWHMPLIDDYQIALESDVADFNHTADKHKFQGGSGYIRSYYRTKMLK